ncbi:MAG: FtsQ-type POTRA domain-containing protein [bacterium]|nr:FtsQ-type POTRA domain-containing protein [bacterium]
MFFRKKEKIYPRSSRKRKNFFEKKEEIDSTIFSRLIFRLLALVFIGATAYILFFSPFLEVNRIFIEGNSELNRDEIQNNIQQSIQGKYFKFIPKNNLILASSKKIRNNLLNDFKKISEVEVKKVFPGGIDVKIKERKSLLVWCSAGPCYIIDEEGFAYTGADFESEEIKQNNLVILTDTSAKPVIMGEKVLTSDYIQFVSRVRNELEKQTEIKIGEYQTGSRMAEEVKVKTEAGWEIYFSSNLPLEESIRTLITFLEKEAGVKTTNNLEYIDLRAENKVYYKFKN